MASTIKVDYIWVIKDAEHQSVKGYTHFTIETDDFEFRVCGVAIMENAHGNLYLEFPRTESAIKRKTSNFKPDSKLRRSIEDAVFDKYYKQKRRYTNE